MTQGEFVAILPRLVPGTRVTVTETVTVTVEADEDGNLFLPLTRRLNIWLTDEGGTVPGRLPPNYTIKIEEDAQPLIGTHAESCWRSEPVYVHDDAARIAAMEAALQEAFAALSEFLRTEKND